MAWNTAAVAAGPSVDRALAEIRRWEKGKDPTRRQTAANLQAETALADADFEALLRTFAAELAAGNQATRAFEQACRAFQLRGPAVRGVMPTVLGRATTMGRFCRWLHDRHLAVSEQDFELLVRRHALPLARPNALLRQAPLGRHVVWATFRNPGRDQTPFAAPLETAEAVVTALGLGGQPVDQTWVMLVYRPRCEREALRLPTVADAGMYSYFRPVANGSLAEHGWTQPLSPNPRGLDPQPELVHGEAIDYDVMLPLLVWN